MATRRSLPTDLPATGATEEPDGRPPESYRWLWLLLLLLLVTGGLLAWWLLTRGGDKSTVPNVLGLRSQVAAARIQNRDLKVTPVAGQSKRPPDVVFAQRPGAGTQVDQGQTVTISISSGRLAVPDVTSLLVKQAQERLAGAGFQSELEHVGSSRPKGVVIEQSPVAGVIAVRGTAVTLNVSSGMKPVVVPRVVGQTEGSAVNTLTGVGLQAVLHSVPSAKPAGIVIAQKPAAGKEVEKGSKVSLNVSRGSGPSTTTATTTATTATTTTNKLRVTSADSAAEQEPGAAQPADRPPQSECAGLRRD
jgi:beta-lactam-binding protein with PASTA domain